MPTINRISPGKQKKIDTVTGLKQKLEKAKAVFLTDYRGLTHQQLEHLRKNLKKVEADFVVVKNRLLKIAIGQVDKTQSFKEAKTQRNNIQSFKETQEKIIMELKNPTAALLAYGDEIAAIKTLAAFIKNLQLPKIKIGLFSGKIINDQDFKTLSTIPSFEVLVSTLALRMKSPIYGLHHALRWNMQKLVTVLSNIKDKK